MHKNCRYMIPCRCSMITMRWDTRDLPDLGENRRNAYHDVGFGSGLYYVPF